MNQKGSRTVKITIIMNHTITS